MANPKTIEVYLTENAWAYQGVYQSLGKIPGLDDVNERLWTMLGALMWGLLDSNILEVIVYNDTRLVEEWNEQIKFTSGMSKATAVKVKNFFLKKFIKFEVKKLDRRTIEGEIKNLQLL